MKEKKKGEQNDREGCEKMADGVFDRYKAVYSGRSQRVNCDVAKNGGILYVLLYKRFPKKKLCI